MKEHCSLWCDAGGGGDLDQMRFIFVCDMDKQKVTHVTLQPVVEGGG